MGSVTYLRPVMNQAAVERMLVEVEAAVADGCDVGERRHVLRDSIAALKVDQERLLEVIEGLRAGPPSHDATVVAQLSRLDDACSGLHTNISLMIRKANRLLAS